jgi:hypothetical protein
MQSYEGGCHCGAVRFRARLDLDEAIVCDCSICRKKGSIAVRIADADFELQTPVEELGLYQFNKRIACHYFCPACGIHPFHRPRSYPELWAVNIRCLDGMDVGGVEPRRVFGSKMD